MKLYFIAILPNADSSERIKALKLELKEKYGVKHALKLPAHITLQIPFQFPEEKEKSLFYSLKSFAANQQPFRISLKEFDSFPPRVIFIKIENQLPVIKFHDELHQVMQHFLKSKDSYNNNSFHPHITIATRDLSAEAFNKIWPEFETRKFYADFSIDSLVLFRHNGKSWDLHEEFRLG